MALVVKVFPHAFINRTEHLEKLISGFESALAGRGKMYLLRGKEGVGKTALVDFFLDGIEEEDVRILRVRCECGRPPLYLLLRRIQAERHVEMDIPSRALLKVAEGMVERDPTISSLLLRVSLLTIKDEDTFRDIGSMGRASLFKVLLQELEEMSLEKPVVVVIDSLERGDVDLLLFLHFFSRRITQRRIMLIATYNPYLIASPEMRDLLLRVSREGVAEEMAIEPFGEGDMRALLERNFLIKPSPRFLNYIMKKTAGNLHYVRILLSSGVQSRGSITSILRERIESLSGEERMLLLLVSIFPGGAPYEALLELLDSPTLLDSLERIMDLGLVEEHMERVVPATSSVRDITISTVPVEVYREANLRVARYLEERDGGDILSLAWHYREAGEVERASRYYLRAVKEFISDMSLREAEVVLHEASESAREPERSRINVYYVLVLYMMGDLNALLDVLGEIREENLAPEERVAYHMTRCFLYTDLGNLEDARREGETALSLAEEPGLRSEILRAIGNTYFFEGDYATAERYYAEAQDVAPPGTPIWARATVNLALVGWATDPSGAKSVLTEAMRIFREHGDYYSFLRTRINYLHILLKEGRHYEVLKGAEEMRRLTSALGMRWFTASATMLEGISLLVEGRYADAGECLFSAMNEFRDIGYASGYMQARALYLYARHHMGVSTVAEMDMLAGEAEKLGYVKTSRYIMLLLSAMLREMGRAEESEAILAEMGEWVKRVGMDPTYVIINGGVPYA